MCMLPASSMNRTGGVSGPAGGGGPFPLDDIPAYAVEVAPVRLTVPAASLTGLVVF